MAIYLNISINHYIVIYKLLFKVNKLLLYLYHLQLGHCCMFFNIISFEFIYYHNNMTYIKYIK